MKGTKLYYVLNENITSIKKRTIELDNQYDIGTLMISTNIDTLKEYIKDVVSNVCERNKGIISARYDLIDKENDFKVMYIISTETSQDIYTFKIRLLLEN